MDETSKLCPSVVLNVAKEEFSRALEPLIGKYILIWLKFFQHREE